MDAEPITNNCLIEQEKALIVNWLMDNRTHAYFCKMQDEVSIAKKVKYMKRVVGPGSSGCRHSKFVAQPPIHEEETINPRYTFKKIAPKLFLKLYG